MGIFIVVEIYFLREYDPLHWANNLNLYPTAIKCVNPLGNYSALVRRIGKT